MIRISDRELDEWQGLAEMGAPCDPAIALRLLRELRAVREALRDLKHWLRSADDTRGPDDILDAALPPDA